MDHINTSQKHIDEDLYGVISLPNVKSATFKSEGRILRVLIPNVSHSNWLWFSTNLSKHSFKWAAHVQNWCFSCLWRVHVLNFTCALRNLAVFFAFRLLLARSEKAHTPHLHMSLNTADWSKAAKICTLNYFAFAKKKINYTRLWMLFVSCAWISPFWC